jgi:adenylate kinase
MIFVAGVSRSGKSHTIDAFAADRNYLHIRASDLLREAGRPLGPLSRAQAEENQHVLVKLLMEPAKRCFRMTILDGHVMIETTDGPFPLPDWVFDQLRPTSIICITDDPGAIAERRAEQGRVFDRREIERLQQIEVQCARDQASRMCIRYHEVRANDVCSFARAVDE